MHHVGEDILLFEAEFLSAIKKKDVEQAKDYFYMITAVEKPKLSSIPLQSLKNYYIRLYTKIEDLLKREFNTTLELHKICNKHIQHIDLLVDWIEIDEYVWQSVTKLIELSNCSNHVEAGNVIQSATNFITHNLQYDLSLKSVAQYIGVHPNYLSMLFKKKLNQNFSDYVNYNKIQESTTYLLYSDFSITKIALHYGFCNASYYTQLFKKYYNVTPNQYRKKHKVTDNTSNVKNEFSSVI